MAESKLRVATDEEMVEDAIETATEATEHSAVEVELDGKAYTLTFTRTVVKRMEREGFVPASIDAMPATAMEALIKGAFEARHPSMTAEQRLGVWMALGRKDELINALMELYMAPINALIADPTEATGDWRLV